MSAWWVRREARCHTRQSYARVGKLALREQQRYAHAKQFKRAKRSLKTLKTFLGRVIRDIARRIRATRLWKSSSRIIPETERLAGVNLARIIADRGYCGHGAPQEHRFKVYTAGQKRRITDKIKCELRRRSAIEPVIGHAKSEHRMAFTH